MKFLRRLGVFLCLIFTSVYAEDAPISYTKPPTMLNIYLTDHILTNQLSYLPVMDLLEKSEPSQTLVLKLSGYGGDVHTTLRLFYLVQISRANIVIDVQSNIYSGHAMLALAPVKAIRINPNALIMFHHTNTWKNPGSVCSPIGAFFNNTNYQKCVGLSKQVNAQVESFFIQHLYPLLLPDEIQKIRDGEDLYLTGKEFMNRLQQRRV